MPRDSDKEAKQAFIEAFGLISRVGKDAGKIRLGKVAIALEQIRKALEWARGCGFSDQEIGVYQQRYDDWKNAAEEEAKKQSPDMDRLDLIKSNARVAVDEIHKKRTKSKLSDIPDDAGIFVSDIPGLDDLPNDQRLQKIDEVRQQVCRGSTLTSGVLNGNFDDVVPTVDTVIDMCWYFKGMAQEKLGEPYIQGALTLPDPDGKLAKFIDGCSDIYPRDSSHLRPQQRKEGGGSQGRGLDVGGRFPGGMNTVLFHPFETESGEKRLYVKFETAGAYGHLRTDKREVTRRPEKPEDEQQSKAHAKAFMSGEKKADLEETREGTVDQEVQAAYQRVYDAATDFHGILDRGKQKSKQNKSGKITGFSRALSFTPLAPNYWDVQTQTKNIDDLISAALQNPEQLRILQPLINDWIEAMTNAGYHTSASSRLGDEVVLAPTDLKVVQSNDPSESQLGVNATKTMLELFRERKAQQPTLLSGSKSDLAYVYYGRLTFPDDGQGEFDFDHVLTVDTQAKQFAAFAGQSKVVEGRITKGTNKVTRNKYFEFTGNLTQVEMFQALQRSGWNMANLTRAVDLKKKD